MARFFTKRLAYAATLTSALVALVGCGGPPGPEAASSAYESPAAAPTPPPELAGGPPPPVSTELAGGPVAASPASSAERPLPPTPPGLKSWREADGRLFTAMAAIPNPESLSAADRKRIYGEPKTVPARRVSARLPGATPASQAPAARVAAKPVPAKQEAARPMIKAAPPPKPISVAPAAPVVAAKPAMPTAPLKTAAPAVPMQTPGQRLTTALGSEAAAGAKLATPATLGEGQPGDVTLSLADSLLPAIQREAGKLKLGAAARTAEVTATLRGAGYEITPNGPQTLKLKAGEVPKFVWTVKPLAGAKGPLRAQIDGMLTGLKTPLPFTLATLNEMVTSADPPKPPVATKPRLDVSVPNGSLVLPGVGVLPMKAALGAALVLLAVILLAALARRAADERTRAAERRRFRTLHGSEGEVVETTRDAMPEQAPSTPADGKQGYVSPMVAAAAAGAVAAAAANHHQHDVAKAEPEVLASPVDPASIAEPVAVAPSEVEPVAPPVSESDTDRPPLEVHSLEPDLALDHIDETQPETAPKPEPVH